MKKNFRENEKEEGRNTMKFTYPAVFHKTEQGTYEGYFPDLACCYAKGDTLDAVSYTHLDVYKRQRLRTVRVISFHMNIPDELRQRVKSRQAEKNTNKKCLSF